MQFRNHAQATAPMALLVVAIVALAHVTSRSDQSNVTNTRPTFNRVHVLHPGEGVFAYSRISPDGQFLAYSSETKRTAGVRPLRIVKVVDLASRTEVFSEPGIDAYWSPDGNRLIYQSHRETHPVVAIWNRPTGVTVRGVAPTELGDYFSWGTRHGRDLILTIDGYYYFLDGGRAALPADTIASCPRVGTGARPLLSKDGLRVTTFVRDRLVVRSLTDCSDVIETGVAGGKADFSWDGRYIAYHAPKDDSTGYEIHVLDPIGRTVRRVTDLPGSSFFPSWTADGRLSFRYDSSEFSGFLIASDVLAAPATVLHPTIRATDDRVRWNDLFADPLPSSRTTLVLAWATWSAHSSDALIALQEFASKSPEVAVATAVDIASRPGDVRRIRADHGIRLPQVAAKWSPRWSVKTAAQMPMALTFVDGVLVDQRLGAQTHDELVSWMRGAPAAGCASQTLRCRGSGME